MCTDEADYQRILRENIRETGKQATGVLPLWFRSQAEAAALVRRCTGEHEVHDGIAQGRGVILLTPHLGCFEVSAIYAAERIPITVLYRQPHVQLPGQADPGGARPRPGEAGARQPERRARCCSRRSRPVSAIGVLPDQVPGEGEGVWVDFFGRPAYTMTLIGKLCEFAHPAVFVAIARRLPDAAGFEIEVGRWKAT